MLQIFNIVKRTYTVYKLNGNPERISPMESKTVMLEWSSKKFEVTLEGFDLIKQLIAQHQVCPRCYSQIDQEGHLLVSRYCLSCIIMANPELTFEGLHAVDDEGRKIYSFTNPEGMTFTSRQNVNDKPTQDVAYSIEQAGFTVPTKYIQFKSNEAFDLERDGWTVYGKLSQSVVVLHYFGQFLKGRIEADFLAYKHGNTIEFNKRTTEHKNMLEKARVLAERTKKNGSYWLNGKQLSYLDESDYFFVVAQLESAVYDAQLAFLASLEPMGEQQELFSPEAEQTPEQEELLLSQPDQEGKPSRKKAKLHVVTNEEAQIDGDQAGSVHPIL